MDYFFEEDIFEVGAEVDAYCSRCKADTPHTVLTKYEEEIRSVQCATCSTTHAYRPPRGDAEEDIPEPIAVRRRQTLQKLPWKQAMSQVDRAAVRPYSPKESYAEGEVVEHPKFGLGYVSEVVSDTKLEAVFSDGSRILVHNRTDLSIPSPAKKKAPAVAGSLHLVRAAGAKAPQKERQKQPKPEPRERSRGGTEKGQREPKTVRPEAEKPAKRSAPTGAPQTKPRPARPPTKPARPAATRQGTSPDKGRGKAGAGKRGRGKTGAAQGQSRASRADKDQGRAKARPKGKAGQGAGLASGGVRSRRTPARRSVAVRHGAAGRR
jgi:hypothetical protein